MKSYTSKEIRNVVMLGHSGSGKTTITESCLFKSGATKRDVYKRQPRNCDK